MPPKSRNFALRSRAGVVMSSEDASLEDDAYGNSNVPCTVSCSLVLLFTLFLKSLLDVFTVCMISIPWVINSAGQGLLNFFGSVPSLNRSHLSIFGI